MILQKTLQDLNVSADQLANDFNRAWKILDLPVRHDTCAEVISGTDSVVLTRDQEIVHTISGQRNTPDLKLA